MNKLIYTYSLVKTLYEQGKDYIDSFWPFVLKVMPKDKTTQDLAYIQKGVKEKFGLDIPQYSLKIIITRAKRRSYLIQQKKQYRLTDKGENYLDSLEPESEVERRINELLENIKDDMNEQLKLSLTSNEIYDIVLSFIHTNIDSLVEFFNPDSSIIQLTIPRKKDNKYDSVLVNYFEIAKQSKPHLYKTLTDIIYGSVISTVASAKDIAKINKKFGHIQIFLDSNYLFSILGLHFPEFNKPATELFNLLKSHKFKLRTFDFTIEEMIRVLKIYSKEQHLYIPGIQVDSIFSSLKSQGFTIEDVREFIMKIEDKIWKFGVNIEPTNIELKDYEPSKDEYRSKLSQYKQYQNLLAQNHDLAVIEKIREIRGTPKREIENSEAIFLTSDLKLSNYNFKEMLHREKATISEVIPDRLLTNILWLKNPTIIKDIPLKSIIAVHSREMFIDRKIWKRFYENLKKLEEDGNINNKDISMLFYNHHIEEVLKTYDESKIGEITPSFIKKEVQIVSELIEDEIKKKLEEQKKIFEQRLTQKELDKEEEIEKKLSKIKGKLKAKSVKKAKRYTTIGMYIPLIIFAVIFIYFLLIKGWEEISKFFGIITGITTILSFFGIQLDVLNIRKYLQNKAFQKIYRRELNELELKEELRS